MKNTSRIAFLMFISIVCSNVHAGKNYHKSQVRRQNSYQRPDLRQQRQQDLKTEQHLQKMSSRQTARFESRHPQKYTYIPTGSKVLPVILALMILAPTVIAISVDKPSPIYSKPYRAGCEATTFGPCEKLSSGSTLCYGIGSNYSVECCVHPDPSTIPISGGTSRCISFDPGGIIGGQPEPNHFSVMAAFSKAKEICSKRPHTRDIADETKDLLRELKPEYLENFNGTECTVKAFEPSCPLYNVPLTLPDNSGRCTVRVAEISQNYFLLPRLQDMLRRLARTFNLPRTPRVVIYNDNACDPNLRLDPMILTGTLKSSQEKFQAVAFSYASLQKNSDDELANVLAHELHHIKQNGNSITSIKTGNNKEAEADIASVVANNNPCLAVWLEKFAYDEEYDRSPLPTFTRENVAEILKTQAQHFYIYPSRQARKALMLTIYKYYRRAQELLLKEESEYMGSHEDKT